MRTSRIAGQFLAGLVIAVLAVPTQAGLFGLSRDSNAEKKAAIREQRDAMLVRLETAKPGMKLKIRKAAGYATFRQTDVNLFLLASANGSGVLHDNAAGKDVFMRMASLGGGVGLGVKDVSVIFVFHDAKVMRRFVDEGWQIGGKADASAKYQDTGVSAEQNVKANVDFRDGTVAASGSTDARAGDGSTSSQANAAFGGAIEIFQFTESGLSLQATVSGTKYWKDSKLNP